MNAHMTDWAIEYLRHVLAVKGWNAADMARAAGVAHSTINRPLTIPDWPHAISRKTLARIAEVSGVDPTPFAQGELVAPAAMPSTALLAPDEIEMIPLYDVAASAGYGTVVEYEPIIDRLSFPREYLRWLTKANPKYLQIISVKGDSMEPTLKDDDIVMLDASKTNLSYDGMFVVRFDGTLHVKRISRSSRPGFITIISDNRTLYPERDWPQEEVDVLGKVIWYGRKV